MNKVAEYIDIEKDGENLSCKVILKDPKSGGYQEETVVVDKNVSNIFNHLREKLLVAFPQLKQKTFSVTWTDEDGDMVTVASDEELIVALTEMPGPVYKIVVNVNKNYCCKGSEDILFTNQM